MMDLETNKIILFLGLFYIHMVRKRAWGSNNFHAFSLSHGLLEIKSNDNKSRVLLESQIVSSDHEDFHMFYILGKKSLQQVYVRFNSKKCLWVNEEKDKRGDPPVSK
jgi:hypothetical protein